MELLTELRDGVDRTLPHLLSHHPPAEYDRCHKFHIRNRTIRICARCLGIYPGILVGVLAGLTGPPILRGFVLVYLLPAPAMIEWFGTADGAGSNGVRTVTGFLLGYAYGLGVVWLLVAREALVIGAAVGYGVLAGTLLGIGGEG